MQGAVCVAKKSVCLQSTRECFTQYIRVVKRALESTAATKAGTAAAAVPTTADEAELMTGTAGAHVLLALIVCTVCTLLLG